MAFISGGEVHISAKVGDDIFAAGGSVEINGASADHLIAAGGELEITAPDAIHDVMAAAGRIRLGGPIQDDVVLFGGDIVMRPEAGVGGSAALFGGRVRVSGPIGGSALIGGGAVEIDSAISGDTTIQGGEVIVGPNARIGGDLRVRADKLTIDPAAVVSGETIRETPAQKDRARAGAALVGFVVFAAIGFFLGGVLTAALIATLLKPLVMGANEQLRTRTLTTLGVGALILLVGPVAIGVMFATLIGAPLALFLLAAYLTALPVAYAIVAYWLGQALRGRMARAGAAAAPNAGARFLWTLLGAFMISILCAIPLLGALVWLAALIAGLGAVTMQGARLLGGAETA
jgi:hypothetical protein